MKIVSTYKGYEKGGGYHLIHTNSADIKICFVTEEIVRIRASFDKNFEEESYVLDTIAWPDRLDDVITDRKHIRPYDALVCESGAELCFKSSSITLVLTKDPISFALYAADGTKLYQDLPGNPYTLDRNNRVTHYSKLLNEDDAFYGFGEKGGKLDKNKEFIRERATDAMGYDPVKMDTLYKHIPFYIRLDRQSRKAVGLFYHNFYESVFNMGKEKSNYWPRYTYFQADGGDIDLFLIGGDKISRVVDNYTLLTGRPFLLPKRALGYQGSSMYYPELEKDSDDAVLDFIDTIKAEGFPIDGFHLSSGYTSYSDDKVTNRRCVFYWNTDRFKNPKEYFNKMKDKSAENVPNIKPGILLCHPYFRDFEANNVFVRDSEDEASYAVGKWWGGDGAFWDFTSADGRKTWKEYLTKSIIENGTNSVWNANCEYDSLLDKDAKVSFDGKGAPIAGIKPVMSTLMCRLSNEAVIAHDKTRRPYSVCRSGSAGIQKYAQTWCGDNYTSWDSLRYNIPIITGMGLSGQPNEGADIGGFAGPAPEEELFVRWVQNGIFQARFSIHSASSDNTVTEPWMFSSSTNLVKDAIYLRYSLLPYLYSLEYEASVKGSPIMRALVYEFQDDEKVYDESFDFMFGRDILVANVLEKGATTRKVYLPAGTTWYYEGDNYKAYEGGQTIEVPVTLSSIPMFIRKGAVIPKAGNRIMSMGYDKVTSLNILIAPGEERTFTAYDDDGITNDYLDGVYSKTDISVSGKEVVTISFEREGSYEDCVEDVTVEVIAKEKSPYWVSLGDEKIEHFLNRKKFEAASSGWYYSQTKKTCLVKYPNPKKDTVLTVSFEQFDLIGM